MELIENALEPDGQDENEDNITNEETGVAGSGLRDRPEEMKRGNEDGIDLASGQPHLSRLSWIELGH